MRFCAKLLLLLLLISGATYADTLSGTLLDSNGNRVAGALVTVCPTGSTGTPCSPVLQVGVTALDGTWFFTIATGSYDVTFTRAGLISTKLTSVATGVPVTSTISGNLNLTGALNASGGGSFTGTFGGNHTLTGNVTLSGNNTLTAGQNKMNFCVHNGILWTGNGNPPYCTTTLETALASSDCAAVGCRQDLVTGFSETFTSNITIGNNSSQGYHVHGYPGSSMTCNITAGGANDCFTFHKATTVQGELLGDFSGNTNGGMFFSYPSTANFRTFMGTDPTVGNNAYIHLSKFFIFGSPTATVSNAVLDMAAVNTQSRIQDVYVYNFGNTIGCLFRSTSASFGSEGPLSPDNLWCDGNYNAGAIPCKISQNTNTLLAIHWNSGVCNHPGAGQDMMQWNGNGNVGLLRSAVLNGVYFENTQNGGSKALDIIDTSAMVVNSPMFLIQDTDTAITIAQSVTHGTNGVSIFGASKTSATNGATFLTNSITGHSIPGGGGSARFMAEYIYGCDVGGNCAPATHESINVVGFDGANHQIYSIPMQTTTGVTTLFSNGADAQGFFQFSCGLTVTQACGFRLMDFNGTSPLWGFRNDSSKNAILLDEVNNFNRVVLFPNGLTEVNAGNSSGGVQLNMRNNSGTGGTKFGSGGATAIEVGRMDSAGNLFFHCATTTFQNCGELTGTFTGGATPRIITAPDSPSVTPSFLSCGTTSTCAQTNQTRLIVLNGGPIALSAGTLTITSLPFTSSTSYVCNPDDSTGINGIDVVYVSGASVTFNGTGTDSIRYTCIGN